MKSKAKKQISKFIALFMAGLFILGSGMSFVGILM